MTVREKINSLVKESAHASTDKSKTEYYKRLQGINDEFKSKIIEVKNNDTSDHSINKKHTELIENVRTVMPIINRLKFVDAADMSIYHYLAICGDDSTREQMLLELPKEVLENESSFGSVRHILEKLIRNPNFIEGRQGFPE